MAPGSSAFDVLALSHYNVTYTIIKWHIWVGVELFTSELGYIYIPWINELKLPAPPVISSVPIYTIIVTVVIVWVSGAPGSVVVIRGSAMSAWAQLHDSGGSVVLLPLSARSITTW